MNISVYMPYISKISEGNFNKNNRFLEKQILLLLLFFLVLGHLMTAAFSYWE